MTETRIVAGADASPDLLQRIRQLVNVAFDGTFSDEDWQHTIGGTHVVVTDAGEVVSHAAVVPRTLTIDGRPLSTGYVEGVATAPERAGQGLGSMAMAEAGHLIRASYQLGALSTDAHHFYGRLGWERWQGPTYVLRDGIPERTQDEDDGIMVLRCDASRGTPLDGAIACEERAGDDW